MTHTEGKWEARCKNGEFYNPLHDLDGYGAPEGIDWDVYAVHPPQSGGNTETLIADAISKGDANLIASAPEMFDALLEVVRDIEAYCEDHNSDHPTDVTICLPRLHSIIAKVKGEPRDGNDASSQDAQFGGDTGIDADYMKGAIK